MSASWYDVLGVDDHASPAEIRTAWKDSIAELNPGDRKFRVCNEAAEVLLDPERRAAYDAEIGVEPAPEAADQTPTNDADEAVTVAPSADDTEPPRTDEPTTTASSEKAPRTLPGVPGWLIIGLAVAVLAVAGLAFWFQSSDADDEQVETAVGEATAAARTTVPLVLSYDYKNPEASRDRALQVLTGDLKTDYADLWQKALITNVKKAKAFATSEVVNAGVACVSDDGRRVGVLVVVDATTGNVKQSNDLTISFTATMEDVDGEWLVQNLDGWDPSALAGDETSEDSGSGSASPSDGSAEASPDAGGDTAGATDCAAG
ncbi:MAG: DnaJ domain-containing protein [Nocardioides sp.]